MPSGRTNNSPENGRGLGHVTPTILAVRSAILATAWLLVCPRDAMHIVQSMLSCDVSRPSLCPSVTFVMCSSKFCHLQTNKRANE